ncbi:MAG: glycosyltransferase family 4 protein [Gemmatimonadetes bacterium]|nr:glycosyltransferase family 4 protein [Gemmatimonadota bacterium]MYH53651.1 glycosyltransferase family 4 protein [Gemmatimonadota bacterium]MYK66962.1 glycosyltransferase family 4 protein [Gemmatimonadota bacterium]
MELTVSAPPPLGILVVNWQDRENPQAGGAEEHLHQVFGRLARRGHRVTLLCSGWKGCARTAVIDGIEVHRTGGRYTFNLAAPLYFQRHMGDRVFDVAVEDLNKVPMLAPVWSGARGGVLLVHHLFGATAFREANALLATATWLFERIIPAVYRGLPCVAVSQSTREDLGRRGLDPARIAVIRNGVELEGLGPAADRYTDPTVVYLGRLKRYKRVDLVLSAIARLREEGTRVRMIVAGKGDARPALEEAARRLGIGDSVHFAGFVPDEQKRELLSRSWVHALTSPKEGWGITSIEASACGTPTVASDSPGLRETVRHGETGLLVPHGDVDALAAALGRILHPATRDRMGRAARAMAERYSWDGVADAFEDLLHGVVATGARSGSESPGFPAGRRVLN